MRFVSLGLLVVFALSVPAVAAERAIDKEIVVPASLEKVCALALEARVYSECMMRYPFVLGAQAVRPLDLAGFYAAIASEREVRGELSLVYLRIMREWAVRAGVAFDPIDPNDDRMAEGCKAATWASPGRPNSPDYSGAYASGSLE